jgi:hypothetical protein
MNVVVAGRVWTSPDVLDCDDCDDVDVEVDGLVAPLDCVPDCVPDEVVLWAAALDATASASVAAITTRFNIRTSASVTHTGSAIRLRRRP